MSRLRHLLSPGPARHLNVLRQIDQIYLGHVRTQFTSVLLGLCVPDPDCHIYNLDSVIGSSMYFCVSICKEEDPERRVVLHLCCTCVNIIWQPTYPTKSRTIVSERRDLCGALQQSSGQTYKSIQVDHRIYDASETTPAMGSA